MTTDTIDQSQFCLNAANYFNNFAISHIKDNVLGYSRFKGFERNPPINILILGAGGTGSWFAPKLVKILNDAKNKEIIENATVIFADGDVVEQKNLIRQNFVVADIGKNKAEVIANRYAQHTSTGINFGYIDSYVVDKSYPVPKEHADKFSYIENLHNLDLIINLIDNGKTRKRIHNYVLQNRNKDIAIIDVGNNEYNGQLNFTSYRKCANPSVYNALFYNQLPNELNDNEDIAIFSCADHDADTTTQQLFNANDFAATVLGNFINSWYVDSKIYYGMIQFTTGSNVSVVNSAPLLAYDEYCFYYDFPTAVRHYETDGDNPTPFIKGLYSQAETTMRVSSSINHEYMRTLHRSGPTAYAMKLAASIK